MNIVKTWFKLSFNSVFLGAFILLIAINIIGFVKQDALIMQTAMPLFIPVLLIFFFVKYRSLGIMFVSFLVFSFLGDISSMFLAEDSLIQTSSILYLLSFLYLILMVVPKFKFHHLDKIIGIYLLVVLSINLYFLYTLYIVMKAVIPNPTEVLLFGIKSLTLIVLGFLAFAVYLNTQTKQSVLFLTAVLFFSLSAMLNYIGMYYFYNWSFDLLQRILYAIGLYVMFKYIIVQNANKQPRQPVLINESYSSENLLA
ncbi:hypothetical protein [Mariniflexile sp.]|uniref:hypothetical protein n=1 Tax=Mariniflexile sp. TaxID=1979402 RepID=UPI00404748D3